ncbi:hypothetical protein AX15_004154 [Amanita polypyramis BW_CC]|nr:hypothetical protein AX15_004154 [Amanita polypyramis BW_CC]
MSDDIYAPGSYKRAVYHPAPSRFTIEFLEPVKQGHSFSYGMQISAVDRGSRMSKVTSAYLSQYDIWRRWEDCLLFQDALEQEYSRLAKEKRQRLLRGKGVKKNGLYLQDGAASFESLPPGPHPDSVAQDIHQYLPRLSKNGTLFWASQATITQRNSELRALVEALYRDDLPTLINEIRAGSIVTDFFGYWRRDFDLCENPRKRDSARGSRSTISSYFTSSNASLFHQDGSIQPNRDDGSGTPTRSRSPDAPSHIHPSDILRSKYYPSRHSQNHSISLGSLFSRPASRPRAVSNASTDSSSSGSDRSSSASTISSIPAIVDEVPVVFGYDPLQQARSNSGEGTQSAFEVLPGEGEIYVKADALTLMTSLAVKRRRGSSATMLQLGQYRDHTRPSLSPRASELTTVPEQERPDDEPRHTVRESWMTADSAATYLEDLNLSLPSENSHRASVATFATVDSAEAVVRRRPPSRSLPPSPNKPAMPKSRLSQTITLSDFEIWTDVDEDSEIGSALGTSNRDSFPRPVSFCGSLLDRRPETPLGGYYDMPVPSESPLLSAFTPYPPSPTSSTWSGPISVSGLSTVSSVVPEGMISIKAALNQSIVVLRISSVTSYEGLRERLYDKFAGQEGLPLSKSFTIALTSPTRQPPSVGRARSGSVSSVEHMEFISSQSDWDNVVSAHVGTKLTLRILDIPS